MLSSERGLDAFRHLWSLAGDRQDCSRECLQRVASELLFKQRSVLYIGHDTMSSTHVY